MLTSAVMIWLRINGDAPSVRRRRGVRAVCVARGEDAARRLVPDAATLCNALEDASSLLRASERAFVRTKLWETARSLSNLRHEEGSRRRLFKTAERSLTEFEEEEALWGKISMVQNNVCILSASIFYLADKKREWPFFCAHYFNMLSLVNQRPNKLLSNQQST